jgi:hypothetical protein
MNNRIVYVTERALTTTVDNIEHIESQSLYGIAVAAEGCGATARDGQQDLKVGPAEPRTVPLNEVCTCAANDVGHL